MKKFTSINAKAVPLDLNDVDTDLIIPAQFLTSVSREGFGANLFKRLRDGDPSFAFNRPEYKDAKILIANDNFGCGSSREHAVWALQGWGIETVIAKSFADIFTSNSAKNGLLLVKLAPDVVDSLRGEASRGALTVEVNLDKCTVSAGDGRAYPFEYDPFRRHCLMNGLEDLDYLLSHRAEIEAHRAKNAPRRFFTALEPNR